MKSTILLAFLFLCASASAQVDTTRELQHNNTRGFSFKNLGADSSFHLPTDTFPLKSTWKGLAFKGDTLMQWTGSRWQKVAGGGLNIYNSDGALTGNRSLFGGSNDLVLQNLSAFDIHNTQNINLENYNVSISGGSDSISIKPYHGRLFIDSLSSGSATDSLLTWNQTTGRVGKLPAYQERILTVNMGISDDTIVAPGIVVVDAGSSGPAFYKLQFPNPATYPGASITLINADAVFDALYQTTYAPVNPATTAFTKAAAGYSYIFKSNGISWVCVSRYTGTTE